MTHVTFLLYQLIHNLLPWTLFVVINWTRNAKHCCVLQKFNLVVINIWIRAAITAILKFLYNQILNNYWQCKTVLTLWWLYKKLLVIKYTVLCVLRQVNCKRYLLNMYKNSTSKFLGLNCYNIYLAFVNNQNMWLCW